MIVIGIPTYNEVDNIAQLTSAIDAAALELGISIVLLNADSASDDGTTEVFLETETHYPKETIKNTSKGKGRNIESILKWTAGNPAAEACIFIDGDVTSFEPRWLEGHTKLLSQGADYTIPSYSRNYQEGNTTNHFVYPLIGMHFDGKAPRQPISGDFGVSRRFAEYLMNQEWHEYTLGYGIDVFMTLHALYGSFNVAEIALNRKLHKPSFDKMIPMFKEVAASYYATTGLLLKQPRESHDTHLTTAINKPRLISTTALSPEKIIERRKIALNLYEENRSRSCVPELDDMFYGEVDSAVWAQALVKHEQRVNTTSPSELARSILPWYLMRVVNYLKENDNPDSAMREIDEQFRAVVELWRHETHPN